MVMGLMKLVTKLDLISWRALAILFAHNKMFYLVIKLNKGNIYIRVANILFINRKKKIIDVAPIPLVTLKILKSSNKTERNLI